MKRYFCLFLAFIVFLSSIRTISIDVYADEAETEESGERGGGHAADLCVDENYYCTVGDIIDGTKDALTNMGDIVDVQWNLIKSTMADIAVTSADVADDVLQYVKDTVGAVWNHVNIFSDGNNIAYSVDTDLQQAVYAALMQYTANGNGGHFFKPVEAVSPVSYGSNCKWGYYYSRYSWNYVVTDTPVWWYYRPDGSVAAYNDGEPSSVNSNITANGWYNSSSTFNSNSSAFAMRDYLYNNSTSWGPALIAYETYADYLASVSADADVYISTGWVPSGVQYITNDGLNYDWAALNSNNYSKLVQAIEDGTISGQLAINENLQLISGELDDIRQTINETQEDVSGIEALLQKYLPFLETINVLLVEYLPLLDDIANAPASVDLSGQLSVLKDIKSSVNKILGLLFVDDVTDLISDFFDDDEDKEDYIEKSIGYILLVLLLFVYIVRIFIHLLAFIVAFFNIEPALCSDFLSDEMYQGFLYLDEIIIPYFEISVWDFEQIILYTVMIFFCIKVFIRHINRFKFD